MPILRTSWGRKNRGDAWRQEQWKPAPAQHMRILRWHTHWTMVFVWEGEVEYANEVLSGGKMLTDGRAGDVLRAHILLLRETGLVLS